eukprot:6458649-Amphidinium_carterae.1
MFRTPDAQQWTIGKHKRARGVSPRGVSPKRSAKQESAKSKTLLEELLCVCVFKYFVCAFLLPK